MIDRTVLVWSAKSVRDAYRELAVVNEEMVILFDQWFPFLTPMHIELRKELSHSDIEMRRQILALPYLPYNLLEIESNFVRIYLRHLGIINYFKTNKSYL